MKVREHGSDKIYLHWHSKRHVWQAVMIQDGCHEARTFLGSFKTRSKAERFITQAESEAKCKVRRKNKAGQRSNAPPTAGRRPPDDNSGNNEATNSTPSCRKNIKRFCKKFKKASPTKRAVTLKRHVKIAALSRAASKTPSFQRDDHEEPAPKTSPLQPNDGSKNSSPIPSKPARGLPRSQSLQPHDSSKNVSDMTTPNMPALSQVVSPSEPAPNTQSFQPHGSSKNAIPMTTPNTSATSQEGSCRGQKRALPMMLRAPKRLMEKAVCLGIRTLAPLMPAGNCGVCGNVCECDSYAVQPLDFRAITPQWLQELIADEH